MRDGTLVSDGKGRATRYHAGASQSNWRLAREGLSEDAVWRQVRTAMPTLSEPRYANAAAILSYAFTEMLNNAIDTSRVIVKLFEHGTRFVSRSEAKRLLAGLERFREVILDFAGVEGVGQGFADEVFRVWVREHSETLVRAEHMTVPVTFMVERARRSAAAPS